MKTSLVIPATNGNFGYLHCLLRHYQDGTVLPDETIVSISNAHLIDRNIISGLQARFDNLNLKIICHDKQMIQGPNRDAATMQATGDIIISNDPDDIPHPQRIEIIKYIFETNDILHLNHACKINLEEFNKIDINSIHYIYSPQIFNTYFYNCIPDFGSRPDPRHNGHNAYGAIFDIPVHCGCPAFKKEIFEKIRWRSTEQHAWDYDFCMDVLYKFNKSMIIDSPLIWYNLFSTRKDAANPKDLGVFYKE